jgi:DNA primase
MNTNQAKKIPLTQLLQKWNYEPKKKRGAEIWYLSPLREERTPSFKVSTSTTPETWYDFGLGQGGTIIDLILEKYNCSISDALNMLSDFNFGITSTSNKIVNKPKPTPKMELVKVEPIRHPALKQYLRSRGIHLSVATNFLEEVHYKMGTKQFFALGFKNEANGYELRSAFFKGCLSHKGISFIAGQNKSKICLFEGCYDFLSYLMLIRQYKPISDVLVLNSTIMLPKALEWLKNENYDQIEIYFDNDATGEQATQKILDKYPTAQPMNYKYPTSEDLNDYLMRYGSTLNWA